MKFLMNGTLYQGSKPVMWSPVEKTALAEAEVEYHDHTSHQVWVRFPTMGIDAAYQRTKPDLDHRKGTATPNTFATEVLERRLSSDLFKDGVSVVIWTTTPWTIPQNRAVAFNPAIAYGLYEVSVVAENSSAIVGEKVLLADQLANGFFASARVESFRRLRDVATDEFDGVHLAHPFRGTKDAEGKQVTEWDYDVPMLPGDHVTDDAGTGFVCR